MEHAGLYIHVPFCKHKCNYCDFYSIAILNAKNKYLENLKREITLVSQNPSFEGFSFSTIYFGGGTPSLLSVQEIGDILEKLSDSFSISPNPEISIEVNPGANFDSKLKLLRDAGVNRLTIGAQSFNDIDLIKLTRIHNSAQAESTILAAQKAGFDNIGIDLIFGIPGQTVSLWSDNLEKAAQLGVQHISMYGLTYENGTPLKADLDNDKIVKCDEELERAFFVEGKARLEAAGFHHYEISNFAKPGFPSSHNQKYWNGPKYLGLGPSAFSFDGIKRWANSPDVDKYNLFLGSYKLPIYYSEILTTDQRLTENVMLGLRQKKGIDCVGFKSQFGFDLRDRFDEIENRLGGIDKNWIPFKQSENNSLLCFYNNHLNLTLDGLLLYNTVCAEMITLLSL
jgi:oxygen-independent coproporphyrinogen III oxidase